MTSAISYGSSCERIGAIEYKMPEKMAQTYIKMHNGKIPNVNDYLCKIVNEEFCLKGHCVKVVRY